MGRREEARVRGRRGMFLFFPCLFFFDFLSFQCFSSHVFHFSILLSCFHFSHMFSFPQKKPTFFPFVCFGEGKPERGCCRSKPQSSLGFLGKGSYYPFPNPKPNLPSSPSQLVSAAARTSKSSCGASPHEAGALLVVIPSLRTEGQRGRHHSPKNVKIVLKECLADSTPM